MAPPTRSALDMIRALVGFDTVSSKSNLALIDFVRDYLAGHGIDSRYIRSEDGTKANLWATIGPDEPGGVVLSGHTDVVPVAGQPWESDPFEVVENDGRLYGRGTADMKSFIAIALSLVPDMLARPLTRPIHFALTHDEEVGCLGAPRLIADVLANLPRPGAVIIGEPTQMRVVDAHKGITAYTTIVTGHEAHSSLTHRGVNAVMQAARLIAHLGDQAAQKAAQPELNSRFDPPYTTIHVGTVEGGTALNIVARNCAFKWEIRALPGDDPQDILARFEAFCRDEVVPAMQRVVPETGVETRPGVIVPALAPEPDSAAEKLARDLTGANATDAVSYATEGGQYQRAGIPAIVCGPGNIEQAHQPNEWIALEQIAASQSFTRRLIAKCQADA
ncbi:MAG: Acetylornithine deacetylase [Alphaproteobacteria bacterium MarineAlpha10_Bin3]|nr:MAG: Acetylornithine deacetylase [Alphaproteobacteria bacterium MarineAlpha10_Bin3]PPR71670.1 MAG: Acetylornithine deacetylase [Alphaproteobacteria bacterium MarineAlpha4_Bin1]